MEDTQKVKHLTRPLDGNEDAFRCSCGEVLVSTSGLAVCPVMVSRCNACPAPASCSEFGRCPLDSPPGTFDNSWSDEPPIVLQFQRHRTRP